MRIVPAWFGVAALFGIVSANDVSAQSGSPLDGVKAAVVIVVARGVDTSQGNAPVEARASGFFINEEGLLVTSYHVRGGLGGGVLDSTVTYDVHSDAFAQGRPAKLIYASPEADVMVLQVPVNVDETQVLRPVSRVAAKLSVGTTPVYAAGYPSGFNYNLTQGTITSFSGPVQPVDVGWTTNVSYPAGMSGSPLVIADGRVVAIVKGSDAGGGALGVVVPIFHIPQQYWSTAASANSTSRLPDGARLLVSGTIVSTAPRAVTKSLTLTRSPCEQNPETVVAVNAAEGWRLDPTSVVVSMRAFVGKSIATEVRSDAGRTEAVVTMEPPGACQEIGGQQVPVGGSATFFGELKYVETPVAPITREVVLAIASGDLGRVPIPAAARNLRALLEYPDGRRQALAVVNGDVSRGAGAATLRLDAVTARAKF